MLSGLAFIGPHETTLKEELILCRDLNPKGRKYKQQHENSIGVLFARNSDNAKLVDSNIHSWTRGLAIYSNGITIEHNYIHNNNLDPYLRPAAAGYTGETTNCTHGISGMGYGIAMEGRKMNLDNTEVVSASTALMQFNEFADNKHHVAGGGIPHEGYIARNNTINYSGNVRNIDVSFDVHSYDKSECDMGVDGDGKPTCNKREGINGDGIAGSYLVVADNLWLSAKDNILPVIIRGTPTDYAIVENNFFNGMGMKRGDVNKNEDNRRDGIWHVNHDNNWAWNRKVGKVCFGPNFYFDHMNFQTQIGTSKVPNEDRELSQTSDRYGIKNQRCDKFDTTNAADWKRAAEYQSKLTNFNLSAQNNPAIEDVFSCDASERKWLAFIDGQGEAIHLRNMGAGESCNDRKLLVDINGDGVTDIANIISNQVIVYLSGKNTQGALAYFSNRTR